MSIDWDWQDDDELADIDARYDAWQAAMEAEPPMRQPGVDLDWVDDATIDSAEGNRILAMEPQTPSQWISAAPEDMLERTDIVDPDPDIPESQRVEGDR